jgi:hypothetical protein
MDEHHLGYIRNSRKEKTLVGTWHNDLIQKVSFDDHVDCLLLLSPSAKTPNISQSSMMEYVRCKER